MTKNSSCNTLSTGSDDCASSGVIMKPNCNYSNYRRYCDCYAATATAITNCVTLTTAINIRCTVSLTRLSLIERK